MKPIRCLVHAASACLLIAFNSHAQDAAALKDDDQTFLQHAARGGQLEVELGELAATRASKDAVQDFGKRMMEDHGKVNKQLKELASRKKVQLPNELDDDGKNKKAQMNALPPEQFDAKYVEMMVKDHEKDVADFEKQAKGAEDADVRAFAAGNLPTLKSHLEKIKALHADHQ